MKKILVFAATIKISLNNQTGIMKKVFAEARVFENQYDVYMWGFGEKDIRYYHDGKMTIVDTFKNKTQRRKKYFRKITQFAIDNRISFFYFRYASTDFYLLSTLEKIKSIGAINVIEIPSYPYKGEFKKSLKTRLIYLLDFLLRNKLKKYVSKIVIFVNEPRKIFGIECINTTNGVDCSTIRVSNSAFLGELNVVFVASMLSHHGLDRLIEGMNSYVNNKNFDVKVFCHIVGDGPELSAYKALCKKYNLIEYFLFYGQKTGQDLDLIFDKANIAIGSLGLHRIGLKQSSTLKNREYASRGLPIIYSMYDSFLDGCKYAHIIPSNDDPIDIEEMINFFVNECNDDKTHETIRKYALERCDMNIVMMPIMSYFKQKF